MIFICLESIINITVIFLKEKYAINYLLKITMTGHKFKNFSDEIVLYILELQINRKKRLRGICQ